MKTTCSAKKLWGSIALTGAILLSSVAAEPSPFEATLKLSRNPVYVGERFDIVLEIIVRDAALSKQVQLQDLPPTTDLVLEAFDDRPIEIRTQNNQMVEIRRFHSRGTALRPGTLILNPKLSGVKVIATQNFFFTRREEQPVAIPLHAVTLIVREIPEQGQPPDFQGAVGTGFALMAKADPLDVAVGDLITVTMQIHGDGNSTHWGIPTILLSENFKSYPAKLLVDQSPAGTLTHSQTVIPLNDSSRQLGPITFSYFDPRRDRYVTLRQGPFTLSFHTERAPQAAEGYRSSTSTSTVPITAASGHNLLRPAPHSWPRSVGALSQNQAADQFEKAVLAYKANRFHDAAGSFLDLYLQGYDLPEVNFNAALASLQAHLPAHAIVSIRRLWHGTPRDPAIPSMMIRACTMAGLPPSTLSWTENSLGKINEREWRWILLISLIATFIVAIYGAVRSFRNLKPFAIALFIVFGIAVAGLLFWRQWHTRHEAVVTIPITARLAPFETAIPLVQLPAGTRVIHAEREGDWSRVTSSTGGGWIPNTAILSVQ